MEKNVDWKFRQIIIIIQALCIDEFFRRFKLFLRIFSGMNGEMEENILCGIPGYSFLCSSAYDFTKRAGGGSYLFRSRRTPEDPGIDKRSYQSRMNRGSYLFRTRRAEEDNDDENAEGFDRQTRGKNYLFRTRKMDKNRGYLFRTRWKTTWQWKQKHDVCYR